MTTRMLALLVLLGCGGESGGDSCAIGGTYLESGTYLNPPGTCPQNAEAAARPGAVTVYRSGDTVTIEFAGLGGSCSMPVDGCKADGKCDIRTATGVLAVTAQLSWTFTDSGFSGSTFVTFPKHPTTGMSCTANYRSTGMKQ